MTEFASFAHIRKDACRQCGHLLIFSAQFKKFGNHRVEVCEWCKQEWHNDDPPGVVEVGP